MAKIERETTAVRKHMKLSNILASISSFRIKILLDLA